MGLKNRDLNLQLVTVITFVIMVVVNALANIIPINGITSGAVSDSYPNLFAPIGFTFSIWALIYSLLLAFTVYQLVGYLRRGFSDRSYLRPVVLYFSLTSLINAVWIFVWHYQRIGLSLVLIFLILYGLIRIHLILRNEAMSRTEKIFVRLPFSVYFGWIVVASIANVATYLVSIGWNRFGIREDVLTAVVLVIGIIIGMMTIWAYKDIVVGLVILWAYAGILSKHLSVLYFNDRYPVVIVTLVVTMVVLVPFEIFMIFMLARKRIS